MNHSSKRWFSIWMMFCLLASMIPFGYAESAEIELIDEIDMGEEIQIDDGVDIDFIQDDGIEDHVDLVLDLEGGIGLDNLNDQLDIDNQDEAIACEEFDQSNAGNCIEYSNDTVFNINGKSIKASDVGNQNNCWKYANAIYNKIWGVSFLSDFTGSASTGWNMLRNLSDNDRRLTVDNLKSFVSASQLGASLRITSCTSSCSQWNNDNLDCGHKGHSLIIVGKDSSGVTVIDNHRADNKNYSVHTRYYTWQEFVNYWGSYTYIKYIKWPNAPVFGGSQPVTATTLQFTNVTYPKTFRINTSAGWALGGGTVESNYDLKTLKTQILNSSGSAISSATVSISGKSYAIRNLDTYSSSDNGVKFSYIKTAGNYKWVLTATDSNGRSLTLEMPFTAVSSGSTVTSIASIKYTSEPSHEYSYKVLYKEYCAYKVVKAFNWHTGPSAYESTAGSASVGETFYTDTVVWNTTTNNMWVKKKGENKYVFAGLHWSDNKWYVDKTQTQYLEFVGDSSSAVWNGCNLSGTLPHGESFALKGTLDSSATMTYVWAEFYKGKSCWGQPTSSCEINSTSYTLYNSALDWSLKFGSLSSGDYELVLHIYGISDRGQKQSGYTITKPFSISGPKDTTSPTISNVEVSNVSSYGYTVTCTVSDNVGVTSVKFPTWTEPNGQDDIVWHEGTLSGSKASFTLNVSDHNNETGCLYITHIYAYDAAGNNTCQGVNVDVPAVDTIAPTVSDLKATDISSEGFTANCTVSDNVGVTKVQFLVCVGNEPWEDGIWHDATISGNKASGRIQVSEHGYRRNEQYFIRAFAWDAAGNEGEYYAMLCIGVPDEETEAETTPIPKITETPKPTAKPTATPTPTTTPAPKTNLSKAKLTVKAQVYTGKALKPAVKVVLKGKTLKKGTDYTVSYKGNKAIGTAAVTVKGKGNYTGTAKTTFNINPKAVSGLKLTAGKEKMTVSWKKVPGGVSGYQLQYGLKKSFSGAKKATVSKASTVKGTIKNLKKGKIYYVRIRSWKKVGKKMYYSAWSAAKKAKVK